MCLGGADKLVVAVLMMNCPELSQYRIGQPYRVGALVGQQPQRRRVDARIIGFGVARRRLAPISRLVEFGRCREAALPCHTLRRQGSILAKAALQARDIQAERRRHQRGLRLGWFQPELAEKLARLAGCAGRGQTDDGSVLERDIRWESGQTLHSKVVGLEQITLTLVASDLGKPVSGGGSLAAMLAALCHSAAIQGGGGISATDRPVVSRCRARRR